MTSEDLRKVATVEAAAKKLRDACALAASLGKVDESDSSVRLNSTPLKRAKTKAIELAEKAAEEWLASLGGAT